MIKSKISGYSLIEMLVVVSIFAVLGVISTQSIFVTIRSARKTEALSRVSENLNYTLGVIERQIQNAQEISSCPFDGFNYVDYIDQDGSPKKFELVTASLFWGTENITSSQVNISSAIFTCIDQVGKVPVSLDVILTGNDPNTTGAETAELTLTSKIYLRQYN